MSTESDEKLVTHLGFPIADNCPCGETVERYQRQELVFNPNENQWNRMCQKCVGKGRVFSETSARVM